MKNNRWLGAHGHVISADSSYFTVPIRRAKAIKRREHSDENRHSSLVSRRNGTLFRGKTCGGMWTASLCSRPPTIAHLNFYHIERTSIENIFSAGQRNVVVLDVRYVIVTGVVTKA